MAQNIIYAKGDYSVLDQYIQENGFKKILLVTDGALEFLKIKDYFADLKERLGVDVIKFDNIKPNPLYESVVEGVEIFHKENCDVIFAVGGGSPMDVAKCIKLYSNMNPEENYLKQEIVENDVPILAVPTTAGTGSEATRYAAIYYQGAKQSVTSYSSIPGTVVFDPSVLKTLPEYQKKSTMMDALCHGIESYWSVNSTEESYEYSKNAIKLILENMDAYLEGDDEAAAKMLEAANLGGKGINVTQTTAGHAMAYKITSLFGTSHGHAAALCVSRLFPFMIAHPEKCIDPRGEEYVKGIFNKIAEAMGCATPTEAAEKLQGILDKLGLEGPTHTDEEQYEILKTSVNPVRLKNHPIQLDVETIDEIYHQIIK